LLMLIITGSNYLHGQLATIDGNVFLVNQTIHDSIKISCERIAPSILTYTTYSNNTGYYAQDIEYGIYDVTFDKTGYILQTISGIPIYSDTTLENSSLGQMGLCGQLSGVLNKGTYTVDCDIMVGNGDTLVIDPGVILKFKQDIQFDINGLLIAEGIMNDSIVFTRYAGGVT